MDVDKLNKITVANLIEICRRRMQLSRLDRQTRGNLNSAISRQHITVQESINADASNAIQSGLTKIRKTRKSAGAEGGQGPSKRARLGPEKTDNVEANGESCDTLQ